MHRTGSLALGHLKGVLAPLLYLFAYVALDAVSYVHPISPLGITPWNPPPGLSLALLLLLGLRQAPWLLVAFVAAEILVRGPAGSPLEIAITGLVVTGGYTAAAWFLRRRGFDSAFASAQDGLLFAGTASVASLMVAIGYVGTYAATGRIPPDELTTRVLHFWVGDLNGLLVLTPAILVLHSLFGARNMLRPTARALAEIGVQVLTIAFVLWLIFGVRFSEDFNLFYLLFLPLVWIALSWGLSGTALALALTQLGLVAGIQSIGYHTATFIEFQLFMLALAFTGLVLGATVSEQQRARAALLAKQRELAQAQQLAAAGELTSALAHELNNPLAALTSYLGACELLASQQGAAETGELRLTLAKAEAEAHRAALVVQRLRSFYRTGALVRQTVRALELLDEIGQRLAPEAKRLGVALRVDAPADLHAVSVDRVQMLTVLQNLVQNGLEAASPGPHEHREVWMRARIERERLELTVDDSGPGFAASDAEALFEPFRTTKADGLGLGLAICRTLIEAHGGRIHAAARGPLGGARFTIELPLS